MSTIWRTQTLLRSEDGEEEEEEEDADENREEVKDGIPIAVFENLLSSASHDNWEG